MVKLRIKKNYTLLDHGLSGVKFSHLQDHGLMTRGILLACNTSIVFETVRVEYSPREFYIDCLFETVLDMRSRPK